MLLHRNSLKYVSDAPPGTKVRVSWPIAANGELVGYEAVTIEGFIHEFLVPIILLKNGTAIAGYECWWAKWQSSVKLS